MVTQLDPPDPCDDGHSYRKTGEHPDGTTFYKCEICGKEVEE